MKYTETELENWGSHWKQIWKNCGQGHYDISEFL